jgi:hypothetical protein
MTEPARISVTLGYTYNLGNFQSLRLDLGVTDSVQIDESLEDATARIYAFTENALADKVSEAKSAFTEL